MTKMTSAYANKLLKRLQEDKEFWASKERESSTYIAAVGEEAVIPDYDYAQTAEKITEIDEKVVKLKHAINLNNVSGVVSVGEKAMTIDMILVRMAQLTQRKAVLDEMRKREPKTRINSGYYGAKQAAPEYMYINYDLALVRAEYERVDAEIAQMQIALDKYNQTVEFDVDI